MTDDGHVTCPQERRKSTRKNNLKKKWTGKEWKQKREGFIKDRGGKCEWCKHKQGERAVSATDGHEYIVRLAVHHPMRNVYGSDVYMDFYLSQCIVLCQACHTASDKGLELCEREHEDGLNHYRWHDAEMCGYCFLKEHPEILIKKKKEKERLKEAAKVKRKLESEKVKKWKTEHKIK